MRDAPVLHRSRAAGYGASHESTSPPNAVAIGSPPEAPSALSLGNYTAFPDAILDGFLAFSLQFPGVFPICPGRMHGWGKRASHAAVYRAYTPRAADIKQ